MGINQWNVERSFALQALTMRAGFASDYPQVKHIVPDLALLLRYQSTGERAFDNKARKELLTIQEQRKNSEIGSESQNPAGVAARDTEAAPESLPQPAHPVGESPTVTSAVAFVTDAMARDEERNLKKAA